MDDLKEGNEKRARLLKLSRGSVMPVYFSRPDAVPNWRNFSLLWDAGKERFESVLYIAPKDYLEPLVPEGNLQRMGWSSRTGPATTVVQTAKEMRLGSIGYPINWQCS